MAKIIPLSSLHVNRLNGSLDNGADHAPFVTTPFYRRWWHRLRALFSKEIRRHTPEEIRLLGELRSVGLDLADAQASLRVIGIERDKLDGECEVQRAAIDNLNLAIAMLDMRYKSLIARDAAKASVMLDLPEATLPRSRRKEGGAE